MSDAGIHPKQSLLSIQKCPYEKILREEIEQLTRRAPKYGYRLITALLVRKEYTVGYKRVVRLMKSANLLVIVKRAYQTATSIDGVRLKCQRLFRP